MHTEALRANLERTAVAVVIPDEQLVLLEIAAPMSGVYQNTRQLLEEINHRYVGWADTISELHGRAMRDFFYYNGHVDGVHALDVYCDLYDKAVREATPIPLREDAIRWWLAYLEKIVTDSGEGLERNLGVVQRSIARISAHIADEPHLAAPGSARLHRLAASLHHSVGPTDVTCAEAMELLRDVLDRVYVRWLTREDPAMWYLDLIGPDQGNSTIPDAISALSHATLTAYRRDIAAMDTSVPAMPDADRLLGLPDHLAITRTYLLAADEIDRREGTADGSVHNRALWLCYLLGEELLAPIHEKALWALARISRALVADAADETFEHFVEEVFTTLRAGDDGFASGALDFVRSLGMSTIDGTRQDRIDLVMDEILTLEFHRPEFAGFTDEWGIRVNPNHLKNIRTYLGIIDTDPWRARHLLAGLLIHLETGGVFIADTDLFQKDVSELLSADIAPVYDQVIHLLRRFPVYFNDIGAEGQLRAVSTRLDEIDARQDPICHFLRKQSHVESNPMLVPIVEQVGAFWASGDGSVLAKYLPEEAHGDLDVETDRYLGLHSVFSRLVESAGPIERLFQMPVSDVQALVEDMTQETEHDREKAILLFRLRFELARKYTLSHADLMERLIAFHGVSTRVVRGIESHIDQGRYLPAIDVLLTIMEDLKRQVLDRRPTQASEEIYRKRHIGTGIPSMYGRYREEKLEAVGLSFRIASLVGALLDRMLAAQGFETLDGDALADAGDLLRLLQRALRVEGYESWNLETTLSMFDEAIVTGGVAREEFADIVRAISKAVQSIVQERLFEGYSEVFGIIGRQLAIEGSGSDAEREKVVIRAYETFLRTLIGESLALQRVDNITARLLEALSDDTKPWSVDVSRSLPSAESVDLVPLSGGDRSKGRISLGNKGFMLTRLAGFGFPIPPGFIITTDLSRNAIGRKLETIPDELFDRVVARIGVLEAGARGRFGDEDRPLLLSVRGGAPLSMPGMLDSFLNVGINPDIVEGFASTSGSPWAAWDAYRRFLQFWGMSQGLDRDLFDDAMSGAKEESGVPKKAFLSVPRMRQLAFEYRALLADHDVPVVDEPFAQLRRCIGLVVDSWNSSMATMYREEMGISHGWGTAVIIQRMVYGNLSPQSGTGVALVRRSGSNGSVEIAGDYVSYGQGDDVVSGLVETFPVSNAQRTDPRLHTFRSLERDRPPIYAELAHLGRSLLIEYRLPDQELEFTFESESPADLHVLQAREAIREPLDVVATFVQTEELQASRIGVGIGVGGGAGCYRVALDQDDIDRLRREHPDDQILLVRPDTVPDDIELLINADALLTALGGATSHAAVVARTLGRTCVVGCRALRVFEQEGLVEIGGTTLHPGDIVSVSGVDGSVFVGRQAVELAEHPHWVTMEIGSHE